MAVLILIFFSAFVNANESFRHPLFYFPNLGRGAKPTASSTDGVHNASLAVDDIYKTFPRTFCYRSNIENSPWLRIELETSLPVYDVLVLSNSTTTLRLSSIYIGNSSVQNDLQLPPFPGLKTVMHNIQITFKAVTPAWGKYVTITVQANNIALEVCEVAINILAGDISLTSKVTQSSTNSMGGLVSVSNDGFLLPDDITGEKQAQISTCVVTQSKDTKPYWQLEISQNIAVGDVYVLSRGDTSAKWLRYFRVTVVNSKGSLLCSENSSPVQPGQLQITSCHGKVGNKVVVDKGSVPSSDYTVISVCEVLVYRWTKGGLFRRPPVKVIALASDRIVQLTCDLKNAIYSRSSITFKVTWSIQSVFSFMGKLFMYKITTATNITVTCTLLQMMSVTEMYSFQLHIVNDTLQLCSVFQSISKSDQTGIERNWFQVYGEGGKLQVMMSKCPENIATIINATGWLNGIHPKILDGVVTRDVCFAFLGNCCHAKVSIRIKNCGNFFVYELANLYDTARGLNNPQYWFEEEPRAFDMESEYYISIGGYGQGLAGSVVTFKSNVRTVTECIFLCRETKGCKSLNYNKKQAACQVSSEQRNDDTNSLTQMQDYVYYERTST